MFILKPESGLGPFLFQYGKRIDRLYKWRQPTDGCCIVATVSYVGEIVLYALPDEKTYQQLMSLIGCRYTRIFYEVSHQHIKPLSELAVRISLGQA